MLKTIMVALLSVSPQPDSASACEPGGCCTFVLRDGGGFYMSCMSGLDCPDGAMFLSCAADECFQPGPDGSCSGASADLSPPCCA